MMCHERAGWGCEVVEWKRKVGRGSGLVRSLNNSLFSLYNTLVTLCKRRWVERRTGSFSGSIFTFASRSVIAAHGLLFSKNVKCPFLRFSFVAVCSWRERKCCAMLLSVHCRGYNSLSAFSLFKFYQRRWWRQQCRCAALGLRQFKTTPGRFCCAYIPWQNCLQ